MAKAINPFGAECGFCIPNEPHSGVPARDNTNIRFVPVGLERTEHFDAMYAHLEIGERFGYPPCCVASFLAMVQTSGEPTAQQKLVSNGSGFIPCAFHTTAIIVKAVTLESLIEGRDPQFEPFPGKLINEPEKKGK